MEHEYVETQHSINLHLFILKILMAAAISLYVLIPVEIKVVFLFSYFNNKA